MKRIYFLFLLISFSVFLFTEGTYCQQKDTIKMGKATVIQDARVTELVDKHITVNENQEGIPGYRIQIFFDSGNNSKHNANTTKAEFLTRYPEQEAYVMWQEPYYKVRVGDFRTQLEAQGFLQQIKEIYPDAFIVKDKIAFPKLDYNIPELETDSVNE